MKIKRLKLSNIRSFVDEEIRFPDGKVLLSGDIGSGKSTILLAIDFALFGLSRGLVDGAGLLRNGSSNGMVELEFEINDKNIIVKRQLKRGTGISQDYGSLQIDDEKRELTALELKQAILSLLNYPREYLTKKSLVYRYTVYTPQDEMKGILQEGKELRVETLRKVFGIDKYKRIKDNVKILLDDIKGKKKEFSGMTIDLDTKKKERQEINTRLNDLNYEINIVNEQLEMKEIEIERKKSIIDKLDKEARLLDEVNNKIALNNIRLENSREKVNDAIVEKKMLEEEFKEIKLQFSNMDIYNLKNKIEEYNIGLANTDKRLKELYQKKGEVTLVINNSSQNKQRILQLSNCPVCMQNVSKEHKEKIFLEEDKKIRQHTMLCEQHINEIAMLESRISQLNNELAKMNNILIDYNVYIRSIDDKKRLNERNDKIINEGMREIKMLEQDIFGLNNQLKDFAYLEGMYKEEKEALDDMLEGYKMLFGRHSSLNADKKMIDEMFARIDREIAIKEGILRKMARLDSVKDWMENEFTQLIETMERNVMLRIYNEFNGIFVKWADMLVRDSNLRLKLDEEFTPRIEQNGHDIDYEYLSGGEKTAVALAYRLALNNVINSIVSEIRTKDVIMLDEPTDGFSDEQLDRMREVLDELNVKQLIIVSHEIKIEGFVDKIIRLRKDEHISKVVK